MIENNYAYISVLKTMLINFTQEIFDCGSKVMVNICASYILMEQSDSLIAGTFCR